MKRDPTVEEVRRVRDKMAAQFNCDLDAMFEHYRALEKTSGAPYVRRSPKRWRTRPVKASPH